jgi:hypothetical protein
MIISLVMPVAPAGSFERRRRIDRFPAAREEGGKRHEQREDARRDFGDGRHLDQAWIRGSVGRAFQARRA